jgi:hypothetical protein
MRIIEKKEDERDNGKMIMYYDNIVEYERI